MLKRLLIDNYALIDKTEVSFPAGFTVITGETGSGKSIMLDALTLLMGARADSKSMGNKERKMVVEASFSSPSDSLKEILEENGIDWDPEELILRREISVNGKSRGFVNDTPVNLGVLSKVSTELIEIHSQHSNHLLSTTSEQLSLLDEFGMTKEHLDDYKSIFREYVSLRNRVKKIKEGIAKGKENEEFIRFRLEQLDKLKPRKGELVELERTADLLSDSDNIQNSMYEAVDALTRGSYSALKQLQNVQSSLSSIDFNLLEGLEKENIPERLESLKIEIKDISDTLESAGEKIESDPEKLSKTQYRISRLYEAMKRFKVRNEDELVDLHIQLKEELAGITGGGEDIDHLEKKLKELAKILKEKADSLTGVRKKASELFANLLEETIKPLGMPNIRFLIEMEKGKMTPEGQDIAVFKCSFNKNHPIQPITEIASGGEISRVMLGIKSVMSKKNNLPTIIFDEIDTGVSGEIAHKMGDMMKGMAHGLQVVSVTHLPQVAAMGDTHFKVYKDDHKEKTVSHIKMLDKEERVKELAGMLSGTSINEVAMENARILLNS